MSDRHAFERLRYGVGKGLAGAPMVEGVARANAGGRGRSPLLLTIRLEVHEMAEQLDHEDDADREAASTPEGETLA